MAAHRDWIRVLAVAGDTLVSGSGDGSVCVWKVSSGTLTPMRTIETGARVRAVAVSPQADLIVAVGEDATLRAFTADGAAGEQPMPAGVDWIRAAILQADGSVIAGCEDGGTRIWEGGGLVLVSHGSAETAEVLGAALAGAAGHAQAKAARRACRAGAAAGRRVAGIYRAGKTRRPVLAEAAAHPEWLQALTAEEMQQVIDSHRDQLEAADPADTAAALAAAWYGFAVAFMLGQFLARRDAGYAVLHHNAVLVMARTVEILQAAPSMPAGIHVAGLDTTPAADPAMMAVARRGIRDLTLAINALLPHVAGLAGQEADRAAARAGTMLAAEISDCCQGRLPTFLNPHGRPPGSASLVIRSKGHAREPRSRGRER